MLGAWLFTLFIASGHAALLAPMPASHGIGVASDCGHGPTPALPANCLQICAEQPPLVGAVPLLQHPPAPAPLWVAAVVSPRPAAAAPAAVLLRAQPPPEVAVLLRSLRLAL
jgi:hypothetical protein